MSDIMLLEQQISGLEAKLKDLDANKDLFVKAQGLHEEAEKAALDRGKIEVKHQAEKEKLAELQGQKREAIQETCAALAEKMGEVLPEGRAVFEISDAAGVFIGWERNGKRRPYAGLSGGERVPFDSALSYALLGKSHKVLIMELAEADEMRLHSCLEHLTRLPDDTQILAMTWFRPAIIPHGWSVINIGSVPNARIQAGEGFIPRYEGDTGDAT